MSEHIAPQAVLHPRSPPNQTLRRAHCTSSTGLPDPCDSVAMVPEHIVPQALLHRSTRLCFVILGWGGGGLEQGLGI